MTDQMTNNSGKESGELDKETQEKIQRSIDDLEKESQERYQKVAEVYEKGSPEEIYRMTKEMAKEDAERDLKQAKTFFGISLEILCKEEGSIDQAKLDHMLDAVAFGLKRLVRAEGEKEKLSDQLYESERKRPSEISTKDLHLLQIPAGSAPKRIMEKVLEKLHNSELEKVYVDNFLASCHEACLILSNVINRIPKEINGENSGLTAEESADMAWDIKDAYRDILIPRRMLVALKGCDFPVFTSKKVEQKNAAEIFKLIDNDLNKAMDCVREADEWRYSEAANSNFKPFANYLDQALEAIADADAALKCYQLSLEKK